MGPTTFAPSLTRASRRRRRSYRPAPWSCRNSAATLRGRSTWEDTTLITSRRTIPIGSTGASPSLTGRRALSRRRALALIGLAGLLQAAAPLRAADVQPRLTGDTRIHDPSVIEVDGKYAAFGTGEQGPYRGAIKVKTSADGVRWTDAGAIGKGVPKWAEETLGFQPTNVWAPSISRRGGTFFLYYCLSSFGSNTSAIGLMTSTSFDRRKARRGLAGSGAGPDVEREGRLQRDRPVPHRYDRRPRVPRLRVVLVRDQAQRAQPQDRQADQRGCAGHCAGRAPRRRDRGPLAPRA